MPIKKTIITVITYTKTNPRLDPIKGLIWDIEKDELPITYYGNKEKAEKEFYSDGHYVLGRIKNVEEIEVPTFWETIKIYLKRLL